MKVLLIPLCWELHTEQPKLFTDMVNAFDRICEPMLYGGDMDAAIAFKPDVIWFQGSMSVADCANLKLRTGAKWFTWTGDCRYFPTESLMQYKGVTDMFLLPFTGELLQTYSVALGRPCQFLFEPLHDWKVMLPVSGEITNKGVSFVGNYYESLPNAEGRYKSLYNANTLYGSLSSLTQEQIAPNFVPEIYQNSYAVIAENNYIDIESYFTPRNLLAMANSCCLARVFHGIDHHFKNMEHCVYYRNKYELVEAINFLYANPDVRNRIAKAGYELVKEKYTYKNWAKEFLRIAA